MGMATNEISSTNDIISCYLGVIKAAFSVSECMLVSQNLDFCESISIFFIPYFFLPLIASLLISSFCPLYRLSFVSNVNWFPFQERDKSNRC